jgi:hypothetical protein
MKITAKRMMELLKQVPEDAMICFHGYDKGCGLHAYNDEDVWLYPKDEEQKKVLVMNPGDSYDGRPMEWKEKERPKTGMMALVPEALLRMSRDMNTQDNRCTSDPIFLLQVKVVTDADPECSDNVCWHNPEYCETVYDTPPTSKDCGDDEGTWVWDEDGGDEQEGWYKKAYRTHWETVRWSFTLKDLEDHMELNGHNIKRQAHNGEWRTYVDHMGRLPGMQAVRKFLMDLTKEEIPSKASAPKDSP